MSRRRTALSAAAVLLLLVAAWRLLDAPDAGLDCAAPVLRPPHAAGNPRAGGPALPDVHGPHASPGAARADGAAAPIPLPDSASVTVQPPPGVVFVLPARVELRRAADGWSGVRMLSHGQPGAWTDLPPGSYRLHADAGWEPRPAALELRAGAAATVALQPLALVAGRVVGARTGQPVALFRAGLRVERADGDGLSTAPVEFADAEGRFALGGLDLGGEPPVVSVGLDAFVGGSAVEPLRLRPPHDAEWTRLLVHAPEPVVTGRIRIADLPPDAEIAARVALLDGAVTFRDLALDESGRVTQPADAAPLRLGSDILTEADGRFTLRLADLPAGSVRLLAFAEGSLPLLTEPFALSPGPDPVTRDLELQPAAFLHAVVVPARAPSGAPPGRVRVLAALAEPLGETAARAPARMASRYRNLAGPDEEPFVLFDTLAGGDYRLTVALVDVPEEPAAPGGGEPRTLTRTVQVLPDGPTRLTLDEGDPTADR